MKIAVSGANGFVGKAVVNHLRAAGHQVFPLLRKAKPGGDSFSLGDLGDLAVIKNFPRVNAVVHLAAISTCQNSKTTDCEAEFHRVNVHGTRKLLEASIAAGARHFLLLSSIKANGESSFPGHPLRIDDAPKPETPYGRSKWEAEQLLMALSRSRIDYTIVRPPLIYGPSAAGNLGMLARMVDFGVPLPIGGIDNRRSIAYIGNVTHFISYCLGNPTARNRTFMVSDETSISTESIVKLIALAKGKEARLLSAPVSLLVSLARLTGKNEQYQKIYGNLEVDITETTVRCNWQPPFSSWEGFRETFGV